MLCYIDFSNSFTKFHNQKDPFIPSKMPESTHYRLLANLEKQINSALFSYESDKKLRALENKEFMKPQAPLEILDTAGNNDFKHNRKSNFSQPDYNITMLTEKLIKTKAKNKELKSKLASYDQEYKYKCQELELKTQKYDAEILRLQSYKEKIEQALQNHIECQNCKLLQLENQNLKDSLKSKEIEFSELLLSNKRAKDDLVLIEIQYFYYPINKK